MLTTDALGAKRYEIRVPYGKFENIFFVNHKPDSDGKYYIMEDRGRNGIWYACTAWWDKPCFDSFIQAVKYLKENICELL